MIFNVDDGTFTERQYLAPTVYKKQGITITAGWNYYATITDAIAKYYYLNNMAAGQDAAPIGQVIFLPTTEAQTMGINVDFYILADGAWQYVSYGYLKGLLSSPPMVFRFYTTDGNGPFYAIYDYNSFGRSATKVSSTDPDTLAALDSFYRETQLLKYRHNSLAGFLNSLALQPLNDIQQQIFNEGSLKLQDMRAMMQGIQGIEIYYTETGAVVGIAILLIIAIIAILAAATAWTITTITEQQQKTKQINDAYQLNEWVAQKKDEIAQQVAAGTVSSSDAAAINRGLDNAAALGNKVATNASAQSTSIFGDLGNLVKWGVVGFIGVKVAMAFKKNKSSTNA